MVDNVRTYDKDSALTSKRGRTSISNPKRERSYSKRAANGVISVESVKCPFCFHQKAFSNVNRGGYKCAKCKKRFT